MPSDDIAISVKNLTKKYRIFGHPGDRIKQALTFGRMRFHREFTALKDVSFQIKKGETVGIVGRNGSGKSTLLQLICGILKPTSGTINLHGRIAALLELGSGFSPEFTGRENVYMNCAVLGLSKAYVDQRFEDIAAFADIGQFLEQPVRTYSSGMVIRLAFAVAINADPEILVVDEALSVGDELFQRKCFARIEAIRASGVTVLFVSHAGNTIVELCDRAVLMDQGEMLAVGPPKWIVGCYQKLLYAPAGQRDAIREYIRCSDERPKLCDLNDKTNENLARSNQADYSQESFEPNLEPSSTIAYESRGACIEKPVLLTLAGARVNNLVRGQIYRYAYVVKFTKCANNVRFSMLIKTTSGVELGGAESASSNRQGLAFVSAGSRYRVEFCFRCALNSGVYFMNAGVIGSVDGCETYLHRLIDIAAFRIRPDTDNLATGIIDFDCSPVVELQAFE